MVDQENIARRLTEPDVIPRQPLSDHELTHFEREFRLTLPEQLVAWLKLSNGILLSGGYLYPLDGDSSADSIAQSIREHPEILGSGMLPVAGDGCGNHYAMLLKDPRQPIVYVQLEEPDTPAFVVASSIWALVQFFLLNDTRWWTDKEWALQVDPAVAEFAPLGLRWI
ncbi:MAG: SMI1/KNR4 family protein [Phycisphaerales bacterium JB039]